MERLAQTMWGLEGSQQGWDELISCIDQLPQDPLPPLKFQGEVNEFVRNQLLLSPIDHAQIQTRTSLANLVANPLRHNGGLGVIKDNALFSIEPALASIDLGNDRFRSQQKQAIFKRGTLGIYPGRAQRTCLSR
jgi:hypothetical protein